jgi:hypothetical protein
MTLVHSGNSKSIDVICAIPHYVTDVNKRNDIMKKLWNAFINWMVASGEKSAASFNKSHAIHI